MASRRGSHKELDKCGHCLKAVTDKDNGILCELCEAWYHASCGGISEEVYKVLSKTDALHWFCKNCNAGALKILKSVGKLEERIDRLEGGLMSEQKERQSEFNKVKQSIEEMEGGLVSQQKETETELNKVKQSIEETDKLFRNFVEDKLVSEVRKTVEEQVVDVREMVKHTDELRNASAELDDIESRRNNIILYRVPESSETLLEERKNADKRFCEQLLFSLNLGVIEEDIRKVQRLGKRNDDSGSSRPILIQLGSKHVKNLIMESLYKLKSLEMKFKNVIIAHDMTKKQREECKALVEEAKRKTQSGSGDLVYRVRGLPGQMRIVQIRSSLI